MSNNLLFLPVLIPLLSSVLLLMLQAFPRGQKSIHVLSAVLQLVVSTLLIQQVIQNGSIALNFGDWQSPFGIIFVADKLSSALVAVTSLIAFCCVIYSPFASGPEENSSKLYALTQILFAGVYGAFLTGDLFNLFVWFEVILITSFVILSLGTTKLEIGGALKYVILNLVSSVFFLTAIGLVYGKLGTLNFAQLSERVEGFGNSPVLFGASALLFITFSIKSALIPFHFWLPASYHNAPPLISSIFGGLLTKVGVYALIRVFTLVFPLQNTWLQGALLGISLVTMVVGVLGAASQFHFRRVLSYHIMSQIGYITLGLAMYSPLAIAASIFYLLHHMLAKTNLFLFAGLASHLYTNEDIRKQGGFLSSHPGIALLFLVPAFSLAGIPPLSGFFAKLLILKAAIDSDYFFATAIAVLVGIFTMFSMIKLWSEAFWKPSEAESTLTETVFPLAPRISVTILAIATVAVGLAAGEVFDFCELAAAEILDPTSYIATVYGELR